MSLREDWKAHAAREIGSIVALVKGAIYLGAILWGAIMALYWLAEPRLEPILSIPSRIEQTHDLAAQAVDHVDALDRRVSGVERQMREMRGDDLVARFDEVRSLIEGPCVPGFWCRGEYWVARTEDGLPCERPEASARIFNGRGLPHEIEAFTVRPVRATLDMERVPFRFMVPEDALPGRAEFFFNLRYRCPGRGEVEQTSTPIQFLIEPVERDQ